MRTRNRGLGLALVALSVTSVACGDDDDGSVGDAAIIDVRDALDEEVRTTLATVLYENPGSREHLLGEAQQNDPDVWEEINADGEVTLEEFRSIPDVQNTVNHYGGDVVDFFQNEMVAVESSGD